MYYGYITYMAYPIEIRQLAINLRKKGYSVKEIAKRLNISVGTSSVWTQSVVLDIKAQKTIQHKEARARLLAAQSRKKKKQQLIFQLNKHCDKSLKQLSYNKNMYKLLCSFLFWTEGNKETSHVSIINSDPQLIRLFLFLLRKGFNIDERKLRAMVHVHEYHDGNKIKEYWSNITEIPLKQFSKNYQKPHTGKRKRENYMGSIRIRYYDYRIALELKSFYNILTQKLLGV